MFERFFYLNRLICNRLKGIYAYPGHRFWYIDDRRLIHLLTAFKMVLIFLLYYGFVFIAIAFVILVLILLVTIGVDIFSAPDEALESLGSAVSIRVKVSKDSGSVSGHGEGSGATVAKMAL